MVRVAPVRLAYNPKTLWFDAGSLTLDVGDSVIVKTARGEEFGAVQMPVFEPNEEQLSALKSPLKPVVRVASDEDVLRSAELDDKARKALPEFKRLAAETIEEMKPVAVEFLFDGDRAIFYFESEERLDFRELIPKLYGRFHVRVDLVQIGVRDQARIVGGLAHCGQELCCKRLGGEFNPVSIRMAKDQGLSLNQPKITGACGRLMCCLRYEVEAYKEVYARAPKMSDTIDTPEGPARINDINVLREMVSLKIEEGRLVQVPLADLRTHSGDKRPSYIKRAQWDEAIRRAEQGDDWHVSTLSSVKITDNETQALHSSEMRQKFNDTYDARASQRAGAVASDETREGSVLEASSRGRKARGTQDERGTRRTRRARTSTASRDISTSRDDANTSMFDASQEEQQLPQVTHRKRRIRSARIRTDAPTTSTTAATSFDAFDTAPAASTDTIQRSEAVPSFSEAKRQQHSNQEHCQRRQHQRSRNDAHAPRERTAPAPEHAVPGQNNAPAQQRTPAHRRSRRRSHEL